MAEAVAAIGVVASILQLVDFGATLVERLNDFVTSTKDVPEAFHNISVQLPLAISALRRLRARVERNELVESESRALKALVDHSLKLVKDVNGVLEKVLPHSGSSSFEKRLLAVRSLRYDKALQNASAQLLQNVNLLTFFQTTHIQENTKDLAQGLGNLTISQAPQVNDFQHGLNLGGAPCLADGNFVGRGVELEQLTNMLKPTSTRQNVVAVVGMGGIGKTQLCIEYAMSNQDIYSSVFWLNAQDESSLRADLLGVAEIILPEEPNLLAARADENDLMQKIRRWFSLPQNSKWLIIFDNLDNPKAPGNNDVTSIDIKNYFPYRSQGSILITTRSRKITFAKQLNLAKFEDARQGLEVLSTRCGKSFDEDRHALDLVIRLDGLPLALASAASFLERTNCTAKEYLDEYDRNWLEEDFDNLLEYGDRTLFTTWNLSYDMIRSQSPGTAEILRILAFFGNEDIDYLLLVAQELSLWPDLGDSIRDKAAFHRSMAKLRDYSLVETSARNYRLHPCLHDWTLIGLNRDVEPEDLSRTLKCIVFSAETGSTLWSANYDDSMSRLASHASRLIHPRLFNALLEIEVDEWHASALCVLGQLFHRAGRNEEAAKVLYLSLEWSEENLEEDSQTIFTTYNIIGLVHQALQDYTKAEVLLQKSVSGLACTIGRHKQKTLDPVHNLALLYKQLNRLKDAEKMYIWSLEGCEEAYGPQDPNTFWAIMALADFYLAKGELDQATKEFQRALDGFDSAINRDHFFARFTVSRLAAIYRQQGEYRKAAAMYERLHESHVRVSGPDHWLTQEAQTDMNSMKQLCDTSVSHDSAPSFVGPTAPGKTSLSPILVNGISGVGKSSFMSSFSENQPPRELALLDTWCPDLVEPSDLRCSQCKINLTDETMRFVCCTCVDHELCGHCHEKFKMRKLPKHNTRGKKRTENGHHFIRCERATVPKYIPLTEKRVEYGGAFGTTFNHAKVPSMIHYSTASGTDEKSKKVEWGYDIPQDTVFMRHTKLAF